MAARGGRTPARGVPSRSAQNMGGIINSDIDASKITGATRSQTINIPKGQAGTVTITIDKGGTPSMGGGTKSSGPSVGRAKA